MIGIVKNTSLLPASGREGTGRREEALYPLSPLLNTMEAMIGALFSAALDRREKHARNRNFFSFSFSPVHHAGDILYFSLRAGARSGAVAPKKGRPRRLLSSARTQKEYVAAFPPRVTLGVVLGLS